MCRAFDAYRADGLTLVAIDVGEDTNVVRRYIEERDLPWAILIDESRAMVDAVRRHRYAQPLLHRRRRDDSIARLRPTPLRRDGRRLAALMDWRDHTSAGSSVTSRTHRGLPRRRCGVVRSGVRCSGSRSEGTAESSPPSEAPFTSPDASLAAVATLPRRRVAAKAATSTTAPGTNGRASRPASPDPIAKPTPMSASPMARRIGPAVGTGRRAYPVGVGGSAGGCAPSGSCGAPQAPAHRISSTPATPPASAAAMTV